MAPRPKKRQSAKKKASKWEAQAFVQVQNLLTLVEDDERWMRIDIADYLSALETGISKLIAVQHPGPSEEDLVLPQRDDEDFEHFEQWLRDSYDIDMQKLNLRIERVAGVEDNVTLIAKSDFPAGAHIVSVPHSAMISTKQLSAIGLAPLLRLAPELARVPSVMLAVVLLAHALNPESPFRPYVRVLPRKFTTPFANFSAQTFLSMRPSSAFDRAVNAMRGLVRRYVRIYTALRELGLACLPVKEFSFTRYLWAVSVVMTRQNEIPTDPRSLALVPIWDLCNHAPGTHTTSVALSPETGDVFVECDAMCDFKTGDPITIFYGTRPNSELLLFSGFLQSNNMYNKITIPLALRRTDPLHNLKLRILEKAKVVVFPYSDVLMKDEITNSNSSQLKPSEADSMFAFKKRLTDKFYPGAVVPDRHMVSEWIVTVAANSDGELCDDGLALARVISMDKETLGSFLRSGSKLPMKSFENEEAEKRALNFVVEATGLVDVVYKSSFEKAQNTKSEHMVESSNGARSDAQVYAVDTSQVQLITQLVSEEHQLLRKVIQVHKDFMTRL